MKTQHNPEKKKFENKQIPKEVIKTNADYNLEDLYDHASSELTLQQTKRDQIITVYLALVSFIVPFALSSAEMSLTSKGLVFLATGIVGILFSLIIIRYRVYKEVYWLTCQTITVLSNCKDEMLNKAIVQAAFYQCLRKKGRGYIVETKRGKKFAKMRYAKKNLFSSETIYFLIHTFMTAVILGLGTALVAEPLGWLRFVLAGAVGMLTVLLLLSSYFSKLIEVFRVLADDTDESFNRAFSKAWFLHFYAEQ